MTIAGGVMVAADGLIVDTRSGRREILPDLVDVGYLAESAVQSARLLVMVVGYGDVDLVGPARARGYTVTERPETPWRLRVDVGNYPVTVALLERDRQEQAGPWRGRPAREVWAGLVAFERAVGIPWQGGVGRTAEALILATHPRAKGGTRLEIAKVPEPAAEFLEHPCNWVRPLTPEELRRRWVHVFDANAQYCAAWIVAELGMGEPERYKGKQPFDETSAGVWKLKAPKSSTPAARTGLGTGTCTGLPPVSEGGPWYTTPTVQRMVEVGDDVEVVESWRWPERSRFLRGAGERIRNARAQLLGASSLGSDLALEAVKSLYRVQTGRLSMGARDERSGWRRPDWGNTVRAYARVNLHRRLSKLTAAPFAIATDGLIFASDVADPLEFAGSIGLPVGVGLGEYSHEGSVTSRKLAAAFADDTVKRPSGPLGVFAAFRAAGGA